MYVMEGDKRIESGIFTDKIVTRKERAKKRIKVVEKKREKNVNSKKVMAK